MYLFDKIFPVTLLPDERDQEMIDFLVELWTNFAIFHNPTPDDNSWPMYAGDHFTSEFLTIFFVIADGVY